MVRPGAKPEKDANVRTDRRSTASAGARRSSGKTSSDRKGLAPLDEALKDYLRISGIGARLGPWAVYRAFQEAAGAVFARHARPVRMARGELLVEVDSAPHLAELKSFRGEDIRTRTNQILGSEDVRRISFRLQR